MESKHFHPGHFLWIETDISCLYFAKFYMLLNIFNTNQFL